MTTNADDLVQRLPRIEEEARAYGYGAFADAMEESREEIERLRAEVVQVRSERDFLVEEYERAVECGKQGYLHCAGHLFNAITNARIDARVAERELAALRERIASLQSAIEKAPSVDGARMTYIEQDRVLDQLYELSREGHRVRLVKED